MSCLAYPSCPFPAVFFPSGTPSIDVPSACCDPVLDGATLSFTINGVNGTSDDIYIDGTVSSCGTASAPCVDPYSYSPTTAVISYTLGAVAPGDPFSIVVHFTYPKCGSYVNPTSFLNIYVSDGANANCCKLQVPITVSCSDNAPFTISSAGLNMSACVGQCDNNQFFITNTGCVTRQYSIVPTACTSAGMTLPPSTTVILTPGSSSGMYPVIYCPTIEESGACTITVTPIPIGLEPDCGTAQVLPVAYNGHQTYDCIDGVCTVNPSCSGHFNSLTECQAGCVTPVPPATLCVDCNFLSLNGTSINDSCDKTCGNVGEQLCVIKNIGFPIRIFTIIGVDDVANTFSVQGEWAGFIAGVSLFVEISTCNDGTYTVVSSVYDVVSNTTTITVLQPVPCNTLDGTITVDTGAPACLQTVHLNIVNSTTGEVILDQDYTPVNQWVFLSYCFTILSFGDYTVTLTAGDCFESFTCQYTVSACQQYTIAKTDCHKYLITDHAFSAPGKIDTVTVSNLDSSYVATYTIDFASAISVEITLPDDGVYTVTISDKLTTSVFQDVIYDLCDLLVCYKKLILDIFCDEKDPCCKECDEKRISEMRFQRAEVNKLIALVGTLFAYINRQKINNLGVFSIDECRNLDLVMIMDVFTKINTITDRCGECKKKTPIGSTSICKSC